jgi:hypothetical protein
VASSYWDTFVFRYRKESSVDVELSLCYFFVEDTFPEPTEQYLQPRNAVFRQG